MKKLHHCYGCLVPVGEFEEPPQDLQDTIRAMGGMVRLRAWCPACIQRLGIGQDKLITAQGVLPNGT